MPKANHFLAIQLFTALSRGAREAAKSQLKGAPVLAPWFGNVLATGTLPVIIQFVLQISPRNLDRSWRCRFFPSLISARFSPFSVIKKWEIRADLGRCHSSQVMSRSPSPCTPSALGSIGKCVSTESLRISGNSSSVYLSYIILTPGSIEK